MKTNVCTRCGRTVEVEKKEDKFICLYCGDIVIDIKKDTK